MNYIRIILFLLLSISNSSILSAQNYLYITSTLYSCQDNFDDMRVSYENLSTNEINLVDGKTHKPSKSDSIKKWSATHDIALELNNKFRVTYSQIGCSEKSIYFDTSLPITENGDYGLRYKLDLNTMNDSIDPGSNKLISNLYKFNTEFKDFSYAGDPKLIAEILYNIAVEKTTKNEFDDALVDYTDALKFNPKDINSLYNRGIVKLKLNDKAGACEDWNNIRQIGSPDADDLIQKYCD